jgi:hypothetical protein
LTAIFQRLSHPSLIPDNSKSPDRQTQYVKDALIGPLKKANIRPFSLYAVEVINQLNQMIEQIKSGDKEGMRTSAKKSLAVLQIFRVQKQIELLIRALAGIQEPNFKGVLERMAPMLNWIVEMAKNPQPDNLLSVYPWVLQSLAKGIESFTTLLGEISNRTMDEKQAEMARTQLKQALEKIDFASIVLELGQEATVPTNRQRKHGE